MKWVNKPDAGVNRPRTPNTNVSEWLQCCAYDIHPTPDVLSRPDRRFLWANVVGNYSQRNWVEVFYREVKGWLGLKEYQVRGKRSLSRHFILVFCAYTFMRTRILRKPQNRELSVLWHKLTGGLRRRWANKPLDTFPEAL